MRSRNSSSFDYLYDHYSAAIYGVISRIITNEDVAEEVLQDSFLRIWNRIDNYDSSKGRLFTWMLNIARNLAIDKTRSREISKDRKTDDISGYVNKNQTEQSVDAIGLREVLDRLSEDQKFVVEHLYLKGYTQSEIAEEFNIPLGTVKTRTRMALIELRALLT